MLTYEIERIVPELYGLLAYGPDIEKLRVALQAGVIKAKDASWTLTIVIPALKNASSTILCEVIGEKFVKRLVKKKPSTLEGVQVSMQSIITFTPHTQDGVVVALWGGVEMLKKLDLCISAKSAKTIIVLSWNDNEVQPWFDDHNVQIINPE